MRAISLGTKVTSSCGSSGLELTFAFVDSVCRVSMEGSEVDFPVPEGSEVDFPALEGSEVDCPVLLVMDGSEVDFPVLLVVEGSEVDFPVVDGSEVDWPVLLVVEGSEVDFPVVVVGSEVDWPVLLVDSCSVSRNESLSGGKLSSRSGEVPGTWKVEMKAPSDWNAALRT